MSAPILPVVRKGRGTHTLTMRSETVAATPVYVPAPSATAVTASSAADAAGDDADTVRQQLFRQERFLQHFVVVGAAVSGIGSSDTAGDSDIVPAGSVAVLAMPYSGPRPARLNRRVVRTLAAVVPPAAALHVLRLRYKRLAAAAAETGAAESAEAAAPSSADDTDAAAAATNSTAAVSSEPVAAAAVVTAAAVDSNVWACVSMPAFHARLRAELLALWALPDIASCAVAVSVSFGFCLLAASDAGRFRSYCRHSERGGGGSGEFGDGTASEADSVPASSAPAPSEGGDSAAATADAGDDSAAGDVTTPAGGRFANLASFVDDVKGGSLQCHFIADTPIAARLVLRALPFDALPAPPERRLVLRLYSAEKLGFLVVRVAFVAPPRPAQRSTRPGPNDAFGEGATRGHRSDRHDRDRDRGDHRDRGDREGGGERTATDSSDAAPRVPWTWSVTSVETTGLRFAWTALAFPSTSDAIGFGGGTASVHGAASEVAFHAFHRKSGLGARAKALVARVADALCAAGMTARTADVASPPVPLAALVLREDEAVGVDGAVTGRLETAAPVVEPAPLATPPGSNDTASAATPAAEAISEPQSPDAAGAASAARGKGESEAAAVAGSERGEWCVVSLRLEDVVVRTTQGLTVEQCETAVWDFSTGQAGSAKAPTGGPTMASLHAGNGLKLRESRVHWDMPGYQTNERNLAALDMALQLAAHVTSDGNAAHRVYGASRRGDAEE